MSENKAIKLFISVTNISDDIIEEAQTAAPRKERPAWMKWCAAAACVCLVVGTIGAVMHFRGAVDPTQPFAGRENVAIEGLWAGGIGAGEESREYDTRRYGEGKGIPESPVKDHTDAEMMSVYRSLNAKSSTEPYQLLLTWAKELSQQAKAGLGMELAYDADTVTLYDQPYAADKPVSDAYMYWLDLELYWGETPLTLSCVSEGHVTYYELDGIAALYEVWSGEPLPVLEEPEDDEMLAALEPVVSFINSLTGRNYSSENVRISRLEAAKGPRINLHFRWDRVLGNEVSWRMVTERDGILNDLYIALQSSGDGKYRLDNVKISENYRTYIGEYPLIPLSRAEEYLRAGYSFGGIHCPVCKTEGPAVDFSEYDYVQVEYYGARLMEYALPYYAFYKHIGSGEYSDGRGGYEEYAVVYVPAVKLEGMEEYFRGIGMEHHP